MAMGNSDKEKLVKISGDIINNRINTMDDLRRIWPKELFQEQFYNRLFDDIVDSFEHIPLKEGEKDTSSFEYLRLYTINHLLNYSADISVIKKAYKSILGMRSLTTKLIDETLNQLLR